MAGRVGASVLMKYFGRHPGQSLAGFVEELKALSDEEYEKLKTGILDGSLDYE